MPGLFGACSSSPDELRFILARLTESRRRSVLRFSADHGRSPERFSAQGIGAGTEWGVLFSATHIAAEGSRPGEGFKRSPAVVAFEGHLARSVESIDVPATDPAQLVCAAYRRWGTDCFARLDGNYSAAIFDPGLRRVLVACDAGGTKPVFYSFAEGFIFGSSAIEVLRASGRPAIANARALQRYLAHGRPDGEKATLLEGVRAIPAAHCVEIEQSGSTRIFQIVHAIGSDPPSAPAAFAQLSADLRRLLRETVLAQSSGKRTGVALSGGIDSSGILACLRQALGPTEMLHAFSFVHGHPALPDALNEQPWMELAANHARATLHPVRLEAAAIPGSMARIFGNQDFPFSSPVILAQAEVFRVAADSGTEVMLSGHGPDTLFGGGISHIVARASGLLRSGRLMATWSFLRGASDYAALSPLRLLASSARDALPLVRLRGRLKPHSPWAQRSWFLERVDERDDAPAPRSSDPMRHLVLEQLFRSVLPTSMHVEECNAMAHGLDNRSPYLVAAMLRLAGELPAEHMVSDSGETRPILRNALSGLVPTPILERRHAVGFAVPVLPWLLELRPWVEDCLGELRSLPFYRGRPPREVWDRLQRADSSSWETAFCTWRWITLLEWTKANDVTFE